MKKFNNKYLSNSHRWRIWDYSAPSVYFITIGTVNRVKLFGEIFSEKMKYSQEGLIVVKHISLLNDYYPHVDLNEFVIMPDHLHLLIVIKDDDFEYPEKNDECVNGVDTIHELYLRGLKQSKSFFKKYGYSENPSNQQIENFKKMKRKMLISKIIGKMKMQISKEINQFNNTAGKTNWQLDFDDRIIRDRKGFFSVKNYIIENPKKIE